VALGDAVDFQLALGGEEKERRRRAVRARIQERVDSEPGLAWASPASWELGSAIVAVRVRGRSALEVGRLLLREHGVDTRAFGPPLNTLRLSPDVSTPGEEIDAALDRMAAAARP
jgi:selenocysteine lyase/cysteine desulfurase